MPILAGIDEAGYGPLLGPLVVSAACFRVPEGLAGEDLWAALRPCVSRQYERGGERVAVTDSKALLRGRKTLAPLEEGALAFLSMSGAECPTLRSLAKALGADGGKDAEQYPWRRGRDLPLPASADPDRVARLAESLERGMSKAGVEFLGLDACVIDVAEFNQEVAHSGNKATALAARAFRLVRQIWDGYGGEPLVVSMDKQGGRNAYRRWLMAVCPEARVQALEEGAAASEYEIADGWRRMAVRLAPRADASSLPVALASMTAKYLRELHMAQFNAYWTERCPWLAPTAGYYTDGKRFLAELAERGEVGEDVLRLMVRSR